jgi:hypothetical protein
VLIMLSSLMVAYALGAVVFLVGLVSLVLLEGVPLAGGSSGGTGT